MHVAIQNSERAKVEMSIRDEKLVGLNLVLALIALGLGYVDILSNVSGHSIMTPYIAGSLQGITPSYSAWGTTIYLIGVALGVSLSKPVSGRFGEIRVLSIGFFFYSVISLTCSQSETVYFYAPCRFAFGAIGGILAAVAQAVALNELPERYYKAGLGYWATLGMIPYTFAVFMGGFWAEYFSWKWLFYANAMIGIFIGLLVESLFYGRAHEKHTYPIDWIGFLLLSLSIVSIQLMLSQGNDYDWFGSPWLSILILVTLISLPLFLIWEWGEENPILDLSLFSETSFTLGCILGFLGFFVIQGLMSLLSVQMQLILGYSSSTAGDIYLAMMLAGLPLAGFMYEISKKLDVRFVISIMFLSSSVVLTWFGLFDKVGSFDALPIPVIFLGLCVAALSAPLATLATRCFKGKVYKKAAEEFLILRLIGGAYGIAFQSIIYVRRTPYHLNDLADYLGGRRYASYDSYGQFFSKLQSLGYSDTIVGRLIARFIRQQASVLALNDAFLLGALILLICSVLVWFANSEYEAV